MIKFKDYILIQRLKDEGLSRQQAVKASGLKQWSVRKYWDYTEDEFRDADSGRRNDEIERWRKFLLDELEKNPRTRNSILLDKIRAQDESFKPSVSAFYRYMNKLREEHAGLALEQRKREFEAVGDTKPGEWAQVDFGEITLRDMFGEKVKVYFYAIVLMFSRQKYFEVRHEPFATKAFVEAMDRSFKFYGSVPKTIIFDQEYLIVTAENCGNILFDVVISLIPYLKGLSVSNSHPDVRHRTGWKFCF
ncbi:MAG: hypothetical protein FWE16_02295 [Firmicutes bacterium]|nr:hypothetical protein [Bacillota bacterium]